MKFNLTAICLMIISGILAAQPKAFAYNTKVDSLKAETTPKELEAVGIKEHLGDDLRLDVEVKTEKGEIKKLADVIPSGRPFILSLVYYSCPNLCNFHLNGVVDSLKQQKWTVGKEFDVVAVSFDPSESHEVAAAKKQNYIELYGREGTEKGWHFLTASKESIEALTKNVGFSFEWSEEQGEWAHSSAAIMITPDGKISRYLHGVYFPQQSMRLALIESAKGKVGDIIDSIVLYCFKYNPTKNKYTIYAYNLMKAGGTVMILLMSLFLVPVWWRERQTTGKNKS